MAKMLGRAARQGFNCPCCSPRSERPFTKRSRRRVEQRQVRAESDAWMREEAEDRADLAIALAVLAEPGERVPLEELLAEFGL